MRYSKWIVHSVLLFTVPSTTLYPETTLPIVQNHETVSESLQIGPHCSYDDILHLLDDLERGELEKRCTEADLEKINHLLINLARQGILPNEAEEAFVLENDIDELLSPEDDPYGYYFSFDQSHERNIIPAILYGQGEMILCKSWIHKQWDKAKKFYKKHKKAVIIGTVCVVVAVTVIGIAAALSSAGAAAAGAAAADNNAKGHSEPSSPSASSAPADPSPAIPTATHAPILQSLIDGQISTFKESITKEQFFQSPNESNSSSWGEDGRMLGSLFAHESFKNLSQQFYDPSQFFPEPGSLFQFPTLQKDTTISPDIGHQEIDLKFSTDYAPLYANPSFDTDFNTLSYQMRGEKALTLGYLSQAVHDLGRAIELDPTTPLPYLERGVAYFGLGEYDRSLEDYHKYTSQTQKSPALSIPDFSLGFAKGLPQGIYDSGEGFFLFLSNLVTHPVHTGGQIWDALTLLSNLANSGQWNTLSEVLAPEVHQLVTEWETLASEIKGELAGYVFGKYGSDIIMPGALAKALSKGLKGAQEISAIYKGLQTTERTLLLESVASIENSAQIGEVIQASQKAIVLAEDLGFPVHEMAQLKKAGHLEEAVANTFETIANTPAMRESYEVFKGAEAFLKPYQGKFMTETQARELIHQTGIQTFPRPQGIPENFRVRLSNTGAGMLYVHPDNVHISIRVMPGKPHSLNPSQQQPYVIYRKHGKTLDKLGNIVDPSSPAAHIPFNEFIYPQ